VFEWQGLERDYRRVWEKRFHAREVVKVGFIGDIGFSAGEDANEPDGPDFCIFFDPRTGEEIGKVADQLAWSIGEHGGDHRFPATWVVAGSPDGRLAFVGSREGIHICVFRAHLQG